MKNHYHIIVCCSSHELEQLTKSKVFQSNVVETEYERVIVDTNSSHDRWWG